MKKHYFMALLLSLVFLFALPAQGFAVAGEHGGGSTRSGGSSGGFGSSSFSHFSSGYRDDWGLRWYHPYGSYYGIEDGLFTGISLGSVVVFSVFRRRKGQRTRINELFDRMPGDKKEKKEKLSEIQKIFFNVQSAWEQEKLEKAKGYYSDKLLKEHQQVLQKNREDGVKNHTKKIILKRLENYYQIGEDSFSIRIDFSCYDYTIDRKNKQIISGYKRRRQYFSQIWYFNYSEKVGKWQADFIQPLSLDYDE